MKPLIAIAALTWKAAFRFRLFWVLTTLLLGAVVVLPLLVKHDGTARGFTQILLTYTLSVITALLGLATLWLACGTLARDIEECQMQLVAVKPVARWQIWLGKWLGLLLLNGALLAVSGAGVYYLLDWRAARLPQDQQAILRNEVFVARAALKEKAVDLDALVERVFQDRIKQTPVPPVEEPEFRARLLEQTKAYLQVVPPRNVRRWTLELGVRAALLRHEPLFMRFKFHAAHTNAAGTYAGLWKIGPPESRQMESLPMSLAADAIHEIRIPPNLWDDKGLLTIDFHNYSETALLFPLEDGFEVLYREGGFATNFARGLGIIFCWLALLAALGLAAASFLSFPVAAFCSASLLLVALSSGTLSNVVAEGTVTGVDHETGQGGARAVDLVLLPVFKTILKLTNLVRNFSPIDALSSGRSITWGQLGAAFGQVVLLFGGLLGAMGITVFTRRELATAQGNA
jgi:hypothetical protein